MGLLSKIFRTGMVTEPLQVGDAEVVHLFREVDADVRRLFGRALGIRKVDAGDGSSVSAFSGRKASVTVTLNST